MHIGEIIIYFLLGFLGMALVYRDYSLPERRKKCGKILKWFMIIGTGAIGPAVWFALNRFLSPMLDRWHNHGIAFYLLLLAVIPWLFSIKSRFLSTDKPKK